MIVEAAAGGLEVECSVIGHTTAPEASEPGEIVLRRGRAGTTSRPSTRRAGWSSSCPRASRRRRARRSAPSPRDVFTRAGVCGLARVDFFVDGDDVLVNELNTIPGFTRDQRVREAVGGLGLGYARFSTAWPRSRSSAIAAQRAYRY